MAQTNLNIRMDDELKQDFDKLCENIGMSMTTAICIFAKKAVAEQRIPFEVTANDPFYSHTNRMALSESIEQLRSGQIVVRTMQELEDMADE